MLDECHGEVARHLRETDIGPRTEDREILVADYPLLPARRRFWENVLRAVDPGGTVAQLRTQLRIVFEAARETADAPVGDGRRGRLHLWADRTSPASVRGPFARDI